MVNSTYADVRLIIDTGLTDANLTSLIVLADAEMTARRMTSSVYTANLKKQISMLLTASLAAMNDVRSEAKGDYMGSGGLPQYYRSQAEMLISRSSEPALISYNEPIPDEDE
jgi:hypothetical protein